MAPPSALPYQISGKKSNKHRKKHNNADAEIAPGGHSTLANPEYKQANSALKNEYLVRVSAASNSECGYSKLSTWVKKC